MHPHFEERTTIQTNWINQMYLGVFRSLPASAINKYIEVRRKREPNAWLDFPVYFIHIPKTAGTSICKSLKMPDPGHLLFDEMRRSTATRLSKKPCFMIVRDPLDRLISTYNYAVDAYNSGQRHPLSFIGKYINGEEFLDAIITEEKFRHLYFMRPAFQFYESAKSFNCEVNVIRFEDIKERVPEYARTHGFDINPLTHEKVSRNRTLKRDQIKPKTADKVSEIFADDERLRRNAVRRYTRSN